jgi:CubicO group peptidase (beta-lactamase class C family)
MNSRRHFIKTTGVSALGMGLLPSLGPVNNLFDNSYAASLPRSSPEAQGISSEGIRKFIAAANASAPAWHSFMLLRHGHVVAEGWWKPFEPSFTHTLYSLSKSFTSTAVGLLVKDGKLDIETAVGSFFPDEVPATPEAYFSHMKVKHLLTMNTGHAEDTMPKLRASNDAWTKTFLAQPVSFEPGTHFLYNTGASYMLGAIVHKITGQTLAAFLGPRLFQPLDIKDYDWETSPQGLNTAGYGLRVKTEDIAKFGQLYLQKGKWNGKEILSESWVKDATSYQTKSQEGNGDWAQGYGYQFWRCKPGFYRGDGAYGQFCIVMPEQDTVMAVTSESWDMQQSMNTIWENILPAIQPASLPTNEAAHSALKKELNSLTLPVARGALTSAVSSRYQNQKFKLVKNDFGATETGFSFTKEGCHWTITTAKGTTTIVFGWENWLLNKDSALYIFPVPGRIHVPSKIAGTATWINDHTLQLNARFAEAMHGDTITCSLNGDAVNISFLNSISEHSKTDTEKRLPLTGILAS